MERNNLTTRLKESFIENRLRWLDDDYIDFELEMAELTDLELIWRGVEKGVCQLDNPHNSCLLYALGLSDYFDLDAARCDTVSGTPPDIDLDFSKAERDLAIEIAAERWGQDNVAHVATFGTLKPKSLTHRFFSLSEGDLDVKREILERFPKAQYGKEPTLEEIVKGNPDKGYDPHPELETDPLYQDWYRFAQQLEGMVAQSGIHASGVVISDRPISDIVPVWKNSKAERITQFDMHDVEELGLIKFDYLGIITLEVISTAIRLIKGNHGIDIDPWEIEDGDDKTYRLLHEGLVTGVFQMETSGSAADLLRQIKPISISELSDINALNRPGPLDANLHLVYIANKEAGKPTQDELPDVLRRIYARSWWTLVYQEQVMQVVSELAGFSLKEADDIRRAMGKKKMDVLEKWRPRFIDGAVTHSIGRSYAEQLWDETLLGFANYAFNASHSVAYSLITYTCAWLKAHYPPEFFCALMSVRSKYTQPKLWAQKAPEYVHEARRMGINIHPPSVQSSKIGFTIDGNDIYFGLNAIRSVGIKAARSIIVARGSTPFRDIWDFMLRVDRRKVNLGTFEALVRAGAFDQMGYLRSELLEHSSDICSLPSQIQIYEQRLVDIEQRTAENEVKDKRREEIKVAIKEAKVQKKKGLSSPWALRWADYDMRMKQARSLARDAVSQELDEEQTRDWFSSEIDEQAWGDYQETLELRKLPKLQLTPKPSKPELTRSSQVRVTVSELIEQGEYIGCHLLGHPARQLFPDTLYISQVQEGDYGCLCGQVISRKDIVTRRGKDMCFIEFSDGTGIAEAVVFSGVYKKLRESLRLPSPGDLCMFSGKVEEAAQKVKIIVDRTSVHKG